jgi:hypothetical protein
VSGTGALVPVPSSPFAARVTPTTLVFANGLLYALNDGGITGYSINLSNGVPTPPPWPFGIPSVHACLYPFRITV